MRWIALDIDYDHCSHGTDHRYNHFNYQENQVQNESCDVFMGSGLVHT